MGVCLATKQQGTKDATKNEATGPLKKPLKLLKQELIVKLDLSEDHYFAVFSKYRFWSSYRKSLHNLEMLRQENDALEEVKKTTELRLGLTQQPPNSGQGNGADGNVSGFKNASKAPLEDNLIAVTWLEDPENIQKEYDEKTLFFSNENLLERENLSDHFSREHKKILQDKNIEFTCKKGRINTYNQDNLFIIVDGEVKIFGVFDGHGVNGQKVSGFASGMMLDFIRNKYGEFFSKKNLEKADAKDIEAHIKRCFKNVQQRLKAQYREYLKEKDRQLNEKKREGFVGSGSFLSMTSRKKSFEMRGGQDDQSAGGKDQDNDLFNDPVDQNQDEEDEFCATSSWETSSEQDLSDNELDSLVSSDSSKSQGSVDREDQECTSYIQKIQEKQELEQRKLNEATLGDKDLFVSNLQKSSYDLKLAKQVSNQTKRDGDDGLPMVQLMTSKLKMDKQDSSTVPDDPFQQIQRRVIKVNQGGLNDQQIRDIQEKGLLERLKKRSEQEEKLFDIALSGTSATLVIQLPRKLIIGWVGDTLVSVQKREKVTKDLILTKPFHMPDVTTEKIRIYNNRGETRRNVFDKKSKIYVRGRMYPGLSVSRSLGDLLAHHIGVKSEPDIYIADILPSDKFITIATDGVWSHLAAEEVGEIIYEFGLKDPGTSCELITQKVKDICFSENQMQDDTTLIVSYL